MAVQTVYNIAYPRFPNINQSFAPTAIPDIIYIYPSVPGLGTIGTINLTTTTTPTEGTAWTVVIYPSSNVSSLTTTLFGVSVIMNNNTVGGGLFNQSFMYRFWIDALGVQQYEQLPATYNINDAINGSTLMDLSVSVNKIASGTNAQILMSGAGSGQYCTFQTMSGNIEISNTGVTTIQPNVILGSMINSSAAIPLTTLATLTANQNVITNSSGYLTTSSTLSPLLGGLGINASGSQGFVVFNPSGVASIYTPSFSRDLSVSFSPTNVGDFKIQMAGSGTITKIYGFVESVINPSAYTVVAKNGSGVSMTGGTISGLAGDTKGTSYIVTPSASNTFIDGDILTFSTSNGGSGVMHLSITYSKST